jgi:RNase H-fold protein (predicted Holliday junction resolvase)
MNSDGSFSLYVHDVTNEPVEIKYTQSRNGIESELTYGTKYVIKRVPELFQLKIGQQTKGGKVPLAQMQQQHAVNINAEDFNRDVKNIKISFTLLFVSAGADPVEMQYVSDSSESVKFYEKLMKTLKRGDKLFFEQVKMTDESGVSREAENMNFLVI